MADLDHATRESLRRFRDEVTALPNESAKTHRFMALVAALFPGSDAVARLARGIEKTVRIEQGHRRLDSYFGNAVIEFEKSLEVSLGVALGQLREQVAGLWNGEKSPDRRLLAIASDGIRWETYQAQPTDDASPPYRPEQVVLIPLQSLRVGGEETLGGFWLWLTGLLFRDAQTLPTAERFRLDFGPLSPAYLDAIRRLRAAWEEAGRDGEARVAFATWRRYLTVTYGGLADSGQDEAAPETVELFLKHTYLAMVARLLVWASLSGGRAPGGFPEAIRDALDGSFFRRRQIENLVESDFFGWAVDPRVLAATLPAWERALAVMLTYDLTRLSQDVLKGVYQELVDPQDRHDLGEYYTPEWLCERLVAEMLPSSGVVGVLDPTCGSGSFLRAAITHFTTHNPEMERGELLAAILDRVAGIDIHPLAVTIARATYALALGDLLLAAQRPVQLPVYLADALFLPNEVRQSLLNGPETEIRFGLNKERTFFLPNRALRSPSHFDAVIGLAATLAEEHARTGREDPQSLLGFLKRSLADPLKDDEIRDLAHGLWGFTEALAEMIRSRENSIWAFIIRNGYRPAILRDRFEVILGNPPWLSYRYISDPDYQAEVKKRAVEDYAIAPRRQKLFTQMELASVFLIHALETYGQPGARLAFVMPRSVMTADQHEALRLRTYKANVALTGLWDLFDVRPLFNVPTCVLFARKFGPDDRGKPFATKDPSKPLPATVWNGNLPERDLGWEAASQSLASLRAEARVIHLGDRTAFSTSVTETDSVYRGAYLKRFHQGATIVPRNFYFVAIDDTRRPIDPGRLYWVETDREQAKEAKPPYKDVILSAQVEGPFLFKTAIAKHILPFVILEPADIVLPVVIEQGHPVLWTPRQLMDDGWRYCGKWFEKAADHWDRLRGAKAEKSTLYQWLDYSQKLTNQDLSAPFLVLYNAAGTNISAAVFRRKDLDQAFLVDHKLYYYSTRRRGEADYLASILNSGFVNETIKPFQSVGLQGERDIHKKVLELPIPLFDAKEPAHDALAKLGREAGSRAAKVVQEASENRQWPQSLARRRALVRDGLRDVLDRIDAAVRALLKGGGA